MLMKMKMKMKIIRDRPSPIVPARIACLSGGLLKRGGVLLVFLVFVRSLFADGVDRPLWKVTLETGQLGPVEALLLLENEGDRISARSQSGSLSLIRKLPGLKSHGTELEKGLFAFELTRKGNRYEGPITAPWPDGLMTLQAEPGQISGSIDGGMFAGSFTGTPVVSAEPLRDYPALLKAFDRVVSQKVFNPDDVTQKEYLVFRETLGTIARTARDDLDLLFGFKFAWTQQPFSHFQLRRFPAPAKAVIAGFDGIRVGYEAARVEFRDDVAVLRVDTMMGNDTIEQIETAYQRITEKKSKALIIDLRGNGGGAFAVKPLVEHVITGPLDAGYFVSQKWNVHHDRPPTAQELAEVAVWNGWSISAFWRSVQEQPLLRIRFTPAEPHFDGPVFVLTDARSASATEMAVDALRSSGRVTIVGEPTAGEMLSQSFFDVGDGFVVSLPVADYYSVRHGRIEGVGVPVDVRVASGQAMEKAESLIKQSR